MTDPYEVLGLPHTATLDEVRQRYRKLAAKYHPDRGGDPWIIKQVRIAYEQICEERQAAQRATEQHEAEQRRSAGPKTPRQPPPTPGPEPASAAPTDKSTSDVPVISILAFFAFARSHGYWIAFISLVCVLILECGVKNFWKILQEESPTASPEESPESALAIGGLIFSLFGLVAGCVPLLSLPLSILGYLLAWGGAGSQFRPLALIAMPIALLVYLVGIVICYFSFSVANPLTPATNSRQTHTAVSLADLTDHAATTRWAAAPGLTW